MGVMPCTCNHCSNILCDTYIPDIGYICDDCKKSFKNWLKSQSVLYMDSKQFIKSKLIEFVLTDTYQHNSSEVDEYVDDFFNNQ